MVPAPISPVIVNEYAVAPAAAIDESSGIAPEYEPLAALNLIEPAFVFLFAIAVKTQDSVNLM